MANIQTLKDVLSNIGPESCPYNVNLHCHTVCSDGCLSPVELYLQASTYELSHFSITDHHSINAYSIINQWKEDNLDKVQSYPTLWTGVEISSILIKCLVHIIGLGFDLTHPSIKPYITGEAPSSNYINAVDVVRSIHDAGGLAILAHPARYRVPFDQLIEAAARIGIDGGEAWYDYDYSNIWKPSDYICKCIDDKLKSLGLLSTCGTDTHGYSLKSR